MFNYRNPIGASVITIPESIGTLTNPLGTNFSVYNIGGYMEVWSVSDLNFSASSSSGFVQLSANTIPPYINKQVNGNVQAYLWSDGVSSGRRRIGQLVYVHQTDQVYQFVVPNYETLWNNAENEGSIQFSAPYYIVTSSPSNPNGTLLVNSWTASTVEGQSGVTRDNARWRIFWGTDWQVTGGSYTVSSATLNLFSNSGNTVQITGVTNFYNSNGSLYSNRSVNLSGYTLTFSGGQTIFSGSNPVVISGLSQGGGNYLTIDSSGIVRFTGVTPGGSVNIYNSDGSLTSNRNVSLGSFTLNFSGNQTSFVSNTTPLFVSATTNPLRISGVSIGSSSNKILVIDDSGFVKFINSISTESFILTVPVNTTNITYSGNSGTTSSVNLSGTSGVTVFRSSSTGLTISAQTLYTSDGTLLSNRNVNLNGNILILSGGTVSITGSNSSLRVNPDFDVPNSTSRILFVNPSDPTRTVKYATGVTLSTNFLLSNDNGGINPVLKYSVGTTIYPLLFSGVSGTNINFINSSGLSISSQTLYNSDGTISSDRNVNITSGNKLNFISQSSGVTISAQTQDPIILKNVIESTGNTKYLTIDDSGVVRHQLDVRVTGGTYNDGTLTFTNNIGGTFQVVLFPTPTNSPTPTITPTNTVTSTVTRTLTPTPSITPSITPTTTPTTTPTVTPTITPTVTPTNSVTPTLTKSPTPTRTVTKTPGASPDPTRTPTVTPTVTQTPPTLQYAYVFGEPTDSTSALDMYNYMNGLGLTWFGFNISNVPSSNYSNNLSSYAEYSGFVNGSGNFIQPIQTQICQLVGGCTDNNGCSVPRYSFYTVEVPTGVGNTNITYVYTIWVPKNAVGGSISSAQVGVSFPSVPCSTDVISTVDSGLVVQEITINSGSASIPDGVYYVYSTGGVGTNFALPTSPPRSSSIYFRGISKT
jgi:hypothetical protein